VFAPGEIGLHFSRILFWQTGAGVLIKTHNDRGLRAISILRPAKWS
jgi:hypothetical protein